MATTEQIEKASRTDEEIARRSGPDPLADPRGIVGFSEQETDPVFQGRGSRRLRRWRPDGWELLIDALGLPEGGPLTPWPPKDVEDDAWMVMCGQEARTDQAAIDASFKATLVAPAPAEADSPKQKPARRRRPDWKWQDDAVCADDGPLFFAPEGERPAEKGLRESLAQELCSWCPVRTQCLNHALEKPEKDGFWGGLNEEERKTERRRRQRRAAYEAEKRAEAPAVIPESKTCGCCRATKPSLEFNRNAKRHDGLGGWCRECVHKARKPTWARSDETPEVA